MSTTAVWLQVDLVAGKQSAYRRVGMERQFEVRERTRVCSDRDDRFGTGAGAVSCCGQPADSTYRNSQVMPLARIRAVLILFDQAWEPVARFPPPA